MESWVAFLMQSTLQMDQIKLAQRRLIIHGAALAVVTASVWFLQPPGDEVEGLQRPAAGSPPCCPCRGHICYTWCHCSSRTAPWPLPHRDGYPGFIREELLVALSYLIDGRGHGAAFLAMSAPHRALWTKHILAKQEIWGSEVGWGTSRSWPLKLCCFLLMM